MKNWGLAFMTSVVTVVALLCSLICTTHAQGHLSTHELKLILPGVVTSTQLSQLAAAPMATPETPTATPSLIPTDTPTPTTTNTPIPTATFTHTLTPVPTTIPFFVLWRFDTPGNFEGWTTQNITGAAVAGGVLSGQAENNDPFVQFTTPQGIEARYISGIAFRLKADRETQCQAFIGIQDGDPPLKHLGE